MMGIPPGVITGRITMELIMTVMELVIHHILSLVEAIKITIL